MIPALVLSLLGAWAPQDSLELAREARAAGRYGDAWGALEQATDPLEVERERVELYFATGEPLLALGHVEAGLALAPGDLGLLHRSLSLSEWVGDPDRMTGYLARLEAAVEGAELDPEGLARWRSEVSGFRGRAEVLGLAASSRSRALTLARGTSLAVMGIAVAGLLLLSVRAGRGT